MKSSSRYPPISATAVGLKNICPRCGQGKLFVSGLTPAERCLACGLDYRFIDSGDGPAVFVILIMGFVILGLALILHLYLGLPLWLQFIVLLPVTVISCFCALQFSKGLMIALQYQTNAREGALDE